MRWTLSKTDDNKWAVIDPSGEQVAVFETRADAMVALDAVVDDAMASLDGVPDAELKMGQRFRATFLEEEESVDKRVINLNATEFPRDFPLPLMWTNETSMGHEGSVLVGVYESVTRDGAQLTFEGRFDRSEAAVEAARLVGEGLMPNWSPDFGWGESEIEVLEEDEDGWPIDFLEHLVSAPFLGGTIVPMQALNSAKIELIDEPAAEGDDDAPPAEDAADDEPVEDVAASAELRALVAAAAVLAPSAPPAAWFDAPEFAQLTPLSIDEAGRVSGHLAAWGSCHIGREDACVTPPQSAADYAYFRTGSTLCADGSSVSTGVITMGTGHAPIARGTSPLAAAEHYDNTGTAVADVTVGEDAHGPWVAGAVRPGVTEEQLRALRGSALSGDWRKIGGNLELVAALAVNVPGFPIPRTQTLVASGDCEAMVAAGARTVTRTPRSEAAPWHDLEKRLARTEAVTAALVPAALSGLDQRRDVLKN